MASSPTHGAHVCLVSLGHLSTSPRLVKEGEALLQAGYRVTVITGRFLAWAIAADKVYAGYAWRHVEVAFGPCAKRSSWLWQIFVSRTARILARLLRWKNLPLVEAAVHPAVPALMGAARRIEADLFIAHSLGALPAVAWAAERQGVAFGFDAEDDHIEELPDDAAHRPQRALRHRVLGAHVPRASTLTAASPMIAASMGERYGRAFAVIRNVFPLAAAAGLEQPKSVPPLRFYWFSQTVGPDRGLEEVLQVISRLRNRVALCLRGSPSSGYVGHLDRLAGQLGLAAGTIEWLPVLPPSEIVHSCSGYALGLSVEVPAVKNREMCLTNKLFAYLLAGTPTLLSRTAAQATLSEQLGDAALLIDLEQPDDAAARIDEWLSDPKRRLDSSGTAWRLARQRYNWDLEKEEFLSLVERAIAQSQATPKMSPGCV